LFDKVFTKEDQKKIIVLLCFLATAHRRSVERVDSENNDSQKGLKIVELIQWIFYFE
jgi:hypothetical protein